MSGTIHIRQVLSLDLHELQPYRTLRRPMDHWKENIFVAEGEKVVRRLLTSGLPVQSLLLTEKWLQALQADNAFTELSNGTVAFVAKKQLVETIVGYNLHQGIMAIGEIPPERAIDTIIQSSQQPHLLVALDGLVNAENVGVVVRNCSAFGVDAILVGETSSSPYLRRAVRNSMGAVFQMPVFHSPRLAQALVQLREQYGTHIVAAHLQNESIIFSADFSRSTCIVFGNEGEGISPEVLTASDAQVAIPMLKGTDSLNVANASAVFLYEARRQRTVQNHNGR